MIQMLDNNIDIICTEILHQYWHIYIFDYHSKVGIYVQMLIK